MAVAPVLQGIEASSFERESGMGRVMSRIMAEEAISLDVPRRRFELTAIGTRLMLLLPTQSVWDAAQSEARQHQSVANQDHPVGTDIRSSAPAADWNFTPVQVLGVGATAQRCGPMDGLLLRALEPGQSQQFSYPLPHLQVLRTAAGGIMPWQPFVADLVWRQLLLRGDQFLTFCCSTQLAVQFSWCQHATLMTTPGISFHGVLWRSGGLWVNTWQGRLKPDLQRMQEEDLEEEDGRLDRSHFEARHRFLD